MLFDWDVKDESLFNTYLLFVCKVHYKYIYKYHMYM
jgi:hypothetical protein